MLRKIFANLNLRKKLFCISVILLVFYGFTIIFVIQQFKGFAENRSKLKLYAEGFRNSERISRNVMALRGDVFELLDGGNSQIVTQKELNAGMKKRLQTIAMNKIYLKEKMVAESEVRVEIQDFLSNVDEICVFLSQQIDKIHKVDSTTDIQMLNTEIKEGFWAVFMKFPACRSKVDDVLDAKVKQSEAEFEQVIHSTIWTLGILLVFAVAVTLSAAFYISRVITLPILKTKDTLQKISEGELPELEFSDTKDETGDMLRSVKELVHNLHDLRNFTKEVGDGNFTTQIEIFQNKGEIADALNMMRNGLKEASDKEKRNNWITQGIAEAGKILRVRYQNSSQMYDAILRFVVSYVQANQGGIFLVKEDSDTRVLQMASCWAYERKKFQKKEIAIGEGLLGQVYLEKDVIYMNDIPENYVSIRSGLGAAAPSNLVILPLMANEEVQGVMELAAFQPWQEHDILFLRQFSELLSIEVATERMHTKTRQLLEVSQQQTEELKGQEEEMRQNMEELIATQEEMERRKMEMERELEQVKEHYEKELNRMRVHS